MKFLTLALVALVSTASLADTVKPFLSCENDINGKEYPRVHLSIWPVTDRKDAADGQMFASDHGPGGRIACNNLFSDLESRGEAICAGIWEDFTWRDQTPDKRFDTVVTLKFKKSVSGIVLTVQLPQMWNSKVNTVPCTLGN